MPKDKTIRGWVGWKRGKPVMQHMISEDADYDSLEVFTTNELAGMHHSSIREVILTISGPSVRCKGPAYDDVEDNDPVWR